MKIKSQKPKGQQIKKAVYKGFSFWVNPIDAGGGKWWFSIKTGEWHSGYKNMPDGGRCLMCRDSMTYVGFKNIYSLKAAKRRVVKWNVPKGTKFRVGIDGKSSSFIITKQ